MATLPPRYQTRYGDYTAEIVYTEPGDFNTVVKLTHPTTGKSVLQFYREDLTTHLPALALVEIPKPTPEVGKRYPLGLTGQLYEVIATYKDWFVVVNPELKPSFIDAKGKFVHYVGFQLDLERQE